MNTIMKIVALGLMINIATGILMQALPDVYGDPAGDPTRRGGLNYDGSFASDIVGESDNITLRSDSEVTDSLSSNILQIDFLGIGAIKKWIDMIGTALYGFPNILKTTIGRYLDGAATESGVWYLFFGTFGFFNILVSVGYAFFAFYLFTGRKVNE